MSKLRYILLQLRTKLWLKPALTGFGAVVWVELALVISRTYPIKPWFVIDRDVLLSLLHILASTMLTVSIFGVSAMVAAFSSVTTTATPRATRVVMQDRSSQNALAAFLSAFIYAIVALVSVSAIPFGEFGRFSLFVGYVFIIIWVLVSFIRWVDQISKLGRVQDTIRRVEEACEGAFTDPLIAGSLGARVASGNAPDGLLVMGPRIGYIQHIDMSDIEEAAKSLDTPIRILARPGSFMDRNRPLAVIAGQSSADDAVVNKIAKAFTIGEQRHIESDPRCGLLMLAEIADRALSPGINDPGTAIAVIGSQIRLLTRWVDAVREEPECRYPHVEVPTISAHDLLDDGFTAIARDGAGMIEVGVHLQKAFRALHHLGHPELSAAAQLQSQLAIEQAAAKLPTKYHLDCLRQIADAIFEGGRTPVTCENLTAATAGGGHSVMNAVAEPGRRPFTGT